MKRAGNIFDKVCTYDNFCEAYRKARRGKREKNEVKAFDSDFENRVSNLIFSLRSETYRPSPYNFFKIYDPKERVISAAPFADRVVQHAVMNICHPYFERTLIDGTHATRPGKGVYTALEQARKARASYHFAAKLDVRHYFDSIVHDILLQALSRLFKDKRLLGFFQLVIGSYEINKGCGVPIGNLTSQYFANHYLSSLDHYIKEKLRVPAYVRYMDDMLLFANERNELRDMIYEVRQFCADNLRLLLKPPLVFSRSQGIPFLGYRVMPHHLLLSGRSKRRFRTKLLSVSKHYLHGNLQEEEVEPRLRALYAFSAHASSWQFRDSCRQLAEGLGYDIS